MYFLKVLASLIFLISIVNGFVARSEPPGDVSKAIVSKTRDLLQEVDEAYRSSNQNCNSTARRDDEYEKLISDYLKKNFTTHDRQPDPHMLKETVHNDTEGFFAKLKHKIVDTFKRNKSESYHGDRLKRCMLVRDFDLNRAQVTIEKETINMPLSNTDEFEKFLAKFVMCLKIEKAEEKAADSHGAMKDGNVKAIHPTESVTQVPPDTIFVHIAHGNEKTKSPQNTSRVDNLLRYLTQAQHPVRDTGRPNFKSPDLQKIQSMVDKMKSFDFYSLDETTTPCPGNEALPKSIAKRNAFDDFSEKIKEIVNGPRKVKSSRVRGNRKQKRKASGLFDNVDSRLFKNIDVMKLKQKKEEPAEVHEDEDRPEAPVVQTSEEDRLLSDLNTFQSRLSPDQQIEISNFLDHIADKPQQFKFDTTPYLLSQMEELNHPNADQQEGQQEDEVLDGAKKYFDFKSSPAKRSIYGNQVEDFEKIAKLKSKLIGEYREHHPIIDYAEIIRKIDADTHRRQEKVDDFLDRSYQLNDGSSQLYNVLKPYRPDKHVMSPYELDLKFKLDNQFKELNADTLHRDDPQNDIPLYKPEIHSEDEVEDFSP